MKNIGDNIESEVELLNKNNYVLTIGGTNDVNHSAV